MEKATQNEECLKPGSGAAFKKCREMAEMMKSICGREESSFDWDAVMEETQSMCASMPQPSREE